MGTKRRRKWTAGGLAALAALMAVLVLPVLVESSSTGWQGEYFADRYLSGTPTLVRTDAAIDFNWGEGSPAPGIPADNFSVRWTREIYLGAGTYRFTTETDDGVRLYVDDRLVIDEWREMAPTTFSAEVGLAEGMHALRMEYYEASGTAVARLSWTRLPSPGQPSADWRGEYYNNPSLWGSPTLVRDDPEINFDWGEGSPDFRIPADNFSIRWTREIHLGVGTYRFTTETDDGVRLYVDHRLVIDEWREMAPTTFSVEVSLAEGLHTVRMEYYEATGGAVARLSWNRVSPPPQIITAWRGEYYNNPSLWGSPTLVRDDPQINLDWGLGSPDPQIPTDNFSVRWTRDVEFRSGHYEFTTETDDGVRLYVDDRLIIDGWQDMSGTRSAKTWLSGGRHAVRMEYYERTGRAMAKLYWQGAPEQRAVGNLITCVGLRDSWIKVYQRMPDGTWLDMKPEGYGAMDVTGYLKIDGLPVDPLLYGDEGHPYRVELWSSGRLARSVGHTDIGQPEFRIRANTDNHTPWQCPAL